MRVDTESDWVINFRAFCEKTNEVGQVICHISKILFKNEIIISFRVVNGEGRYGGKEENSNFIR